MIDFDPTRGVRQTVFGDDGNCLRAALATVTRMALDAVVDVLDGSEPEERWFERVQDWGSENGFSITADLDPPDGLGIAVGTTSTRPGQHHAVVCWRGLLLFDPHPSDALLDDIHHYLWITRDSRLMREAARPGTGLDPKDESGGGEANRPNSLSVSTTSIATPHKKRG